MNKNPPKFLWFLTLTFTMIIAFANWFDLRLIKILGFTTDAGTLIFPLTFLVSNLITEIYGFKFARRAIWCGFLFNLLFVVYGQIVIHLPSPDFATQNESFDSLFAFNTRIILASFISYFCAEPTNSFIMAKLKIKTHGHYLALRFVASTFVAAGIDSFLFSFCAFYNTMPFKNWISFVLTMWFIKVFIEFLGLPISIFLTNKIKKIEKMDIYDKRTKFNLFNLDTNYTQKDNEFY